MMKIFKYLDGGEMLGGELELIKKAPPGIKEVLYNYHDKVYNDFYAKNPNRVVLRNKAKAYGQAAPTPLNIIKQIYNYIGSDPTYGLRAKIALDNRAFDRLPTKGKINTFWDALLPSRPFYNIYKSTQKFLNGGKNHWKFSERSVGNLGNGYSVTNHWIYQDRVNGLSQGDFPPTVAGRTIYTSPYRSDTLYWRSLDPGQDFLFEQVPTKSKDLKGAKQNFYKWVNRSLPESSRSNGAYQRAKRGYQEGGELPTAPRAEQRYRNGIYTHRVLKPSIPVNDSTTVDAVKTNNAGFFGKEGYILRAVDHSSINPAYNDTTYMEVPPVSNFLVNLKTRGIRKQTPIGGNSYYQIPYYYFGMFGGEGKSTSPKDAQEYRTMTNRFNTAYRVSKH